MCNFLSALVTSDGEILTSPLVDSHSDLALVYGLPDRSAVDPAYARVELVPDVGDDSVTWEWEVDETADSRPGWFDGEAEARAEAKLRVRAEAMVRTEGHIPLIASGTWILTGSVRVDRIIGGRVFAVGGKAAVRTISDHAAVDRIGGHAAVQYIADHAAVDRIADHAAVDRITGRAQVETIGGDATVDRITGRAQVETIGGDATVGHICRYVTTGMIDDSVVVLQDDRNR